MGYFRSQLEALHQSQGGPTQVPGQPRSTPIAAYEGGSLAYACLIRWAKVGDADSDWVFAGSVPFRAWPRRLHELPSGAVINRFELQFRAAELAALGLSNPWVIASVHPWTADRYADSPARPSPDFKREQLEAAERSGDVASYQRNIGWDLFSTDKAWRTAVIEERRIAPDITTGRLKPPEPPKGHEGRLRALKNPYYCVAVCSHTPEIEEQRERLNVAPARYLYRDLSRPAPPPDVIVAAMLRHPVADELRKLTQDGSLFGVRNMGLGRRALKAFEVHAKTKELGEAVLQLCARKALAGPPVTESVYSAEWSSKRTVASLMEETYLRVLYAVNERMRRADVTTLQPKVSLENESEGESTGAERTLLRARPRVPEHLGKETTLRSRTVKRLVLGGAVAEAIRVLGDYRPISQEDHEARDALLAAGERGWRASSLEAHGVAPTVLRREVLLRLTQSGNEYVSEIPELEVLARGPTPATALENVVRRVRDEAQRLIRALSHTLSPAERMRKGMLLGLVDPVASRLLDGVAGPVWVLGTLVEDGDGLWLEVREGQRYEVPPSLRVAADGRPRFAQMTAGDAGQPVDPMLKLEAAGTDEPEAVLEAWRTRVHGAA